MILRVQPELRVNRVEGVVRRVCDPDSLPQLSVDHDVVLALPCRPDVEEVRVNGAHNFTRSVVAFRHGADCLSADKGIMRAHAANEDSRLPEIHLENVDVPWTAINDHASMDYSRRHNARSRRIELLRSDGPRPDGDGYDQRKEFVSHT